MTIEHHPFLRPAHRDQAAPWGASCTLSPQGAHTLSIAIDTRSYDLEPVAVSSAIRLILPHGVRLGVNSFSHLGPETNLAASSAGDLRPLGRPREVVSHAPQRGTAIAPPCACRSEASKVLHCCSVTALNIHHRRGRRAAGRCSQIS